MVKDGRAGYWLDLELMPYTPAFSVQETILKGRIIDQFPSTIILQENFSVFTIGRTGSRSNILASPKELKRIGIDVLEVNRGGDITYHGPGQLIVSPLLYLGDIHLNANQYLHRLEDLLIELLSIYDIKGQKKKDYPGVWIQDAKIGAVGIAVKHGYTFHGFSLNVNLELGPFRLINPCGVSRMPVVSLQKILGHHVPMADVKEQLFDVFNKMFSFHLTPISLGNVKKALSYSGT